MEMELTPDTAIDWLGTLIEQVERGSKHCKEMERKSIRNHEDYWRGKRLAYEEIRDALIRIHVKEVRGIGKVHDGA